jgi:hypothetical protein
MLNMSRTQIQNQNNLLISGKYKLEFHTCNNSYVGQLAIKEHIRYITSNKPQSAYDIHIPHNAHECGPTETTMTLLQPIQKIKHINTLENYYVHYFHNNLIIKEQNQNERNPFLNQFKICSLPCKRIISPTINPTPKHYSTSHTIP